MTKPPKDNDSIPEQGYVLQLPKDQYLTMRETVEILEAVFAHTAPFKHRQPQFVHMVIQAAMGCAQQIDGETNPVKPCGERCYPSYDGKGWVKFVSVDSRGEPITTREMNQPKIEVAR